MKTEASLPDKHRKRLYPVVLDLFSKHDFHQVSVRAISSESGVSLGTIYKYFPSKEDLVFTVLDENIREIERLIEEHVQGLFSFKEVFRKLLWVTLDYYDRTPGLAVTAFITVPTRTWMQQKAYRSPKKWFAQVLEDALATGQVDPMIDVRRLQDIFYMVCYRLIHSWHYFGAKWKLVEAMARDFDLFWKMLAPPSNDAPTPPSAEKNE